MQELEELDVTKPMTCRNNEDIASVEYLFNINKFRGLHFAPDCPMAAFLFTYKDGSQNVQYRYKNGWFHEQCESGRDVINVPEKPAFSWDKPIRHKITGDICVFRARRNGDNLYPWLLAFKDEFGDYWHEIYKEDPNKDLENYEPEEKYEVFYLDTTVINVKKYHVINSENNRCIGYFTEKKDAEAFKQLKESGAV